MLQGWEKQPQDQAMHLPGSHQMSYGKAFFTSLPWTQFIPMSSQLGWADPLTDAKEDPLFAPQMSGIGERLRVIYALEPRAVTIRALRAAGRYSVTYFDPVTGERWTTVGVSPIRSSTDSA